MMQMLLVCPLWSDGQCERAVNTLSSVLSMVLFYRKFMKDSTPWRKETMKDL